MAVKGLGWTALGGTLLLVAMGTARAASGTAQAPPPRERVLMDGGWRFHRGDFEGPQTGVAVERWRWQEVAFTRGTRSAELARLTGPDVDASGSGWQDATPGQDTFQGRRGFAVYRATLGDVPGPHRVLHFESVDDNAVVFLNGKRLMDHQGWDDPFDVPLDTAWKEGGPNVVAVLVQNNEGAGGIGETRLRTVTDVAPDAARVGYDDAGWRPVHLPHDFVVEGTFTPTGDAGHGFLPKTVGWYRKTFTVPAADRGRRVWIDFDGIYRDSNIWLNGHFLGNHKSGYTGFRYDITDVANYGGENTLAVRADARASEGWWYEGGGIYRHVWLNSAEPLHVAPWGTFVTSQVSDPDAANPASATLSVTTTLTNAGSAPAPATLVSEIQGPDGKTVARASVDQTLAAGATVDVPQRVTVTSPRLWSLEAPRLYRLVTRVQRGGQTVDGVTTSFGIRTVRFDPEKGLFLNGKAVKIQGTCNHQDFAGVGIAVPDNLEAWRVKKLQEMGSNAWRMSHNPPTAELLDACDRLGMLVMDENRHLGDTYAAKTAPGTGTSDLSDLRSLILRDRNHPSVIMWSLCNEEPLQGSEEGKRIFSAMMDVVHRYDTTRPITCAMNGGWGQEITDVEDLQGINYSPGAYDGFHQSHPTMPLYGSETGSTVSTRGIYRLDRFDRYYGDQARGYVSAYDLNAPPWAQTAEDAWQPIAARPFVAGGFMWTGFDYKGEPTPFGWPCINSHFGILDEAGFPKDNFYYYQAVWGTKPVVHLLPHWNWPGRDGQPIPVWAYSNADRVELFLNGKSLGAKDMPRLGHLEWQVPYAPGTLEARAYRGGKQIASDKVETAGAPAKLRLTADRTTLSADGEDVVPVAVEVLDARGRVVPAADDEVAFAVTGAGQVAGVGNGDPSSHEPDKATRRHAFNGKCLVVVGSGEAPGDIHLTATAAGLPPATLTLRAVPPSPQ